MSGAPWGRRSRPAVPRQRGSQPPAQRQASRRPGRPDDPVVEPFTLEHGLLDPLFRGDPPGKWVRLDAPLPAGAGTRGSVRWCRGPPGILLSKASAFGIAAVLLLPPIAQLR